MPIPTEPIGSVSRPPELIEAVRSASEEGVSAAELDSP